MILIFAAFVGCFLAYANGANDNFKGVATLFGSGTTDFKRALAWGTGTTFLGSLVAIVLAQGLVATFSGKGLVPDAVLALKTFSIAVVLAAAATVMLATRFGFPISTTHAITGALAGAGYFASEVGVNFSKLGTAFFMPLLLSPLIATVSAVVIYPVFRAAKVRLGIGKETCLCVGTEIVGVVPAGTTAEQALLMQGIRELPVVSVGQAAVCRERYTGSVVGINAGSALDGLHFLSAGIVSFARGLNDTPKIAALLLLGASLPPTLAFVLVAGTMAVGGLLNSKSVAKTMALNVTEMNPGQGFTANFITGALVIFASKLGMPVSTTHVSCGTLFGIGASTGQANWKTVASILLAWVTTLPLAAAFGALLFTGLSRI